MQFSETIDYNEMFSWHDAIDEEYEAALEKGLPNPILYIVEKFTLRSPCGLIFLYRYAGRYASATLWYQSVFQVLSLCLTRAERITAAPPFPQDCVLLLDPRQHPLLHACDFVRRVHDVDHSRVHLSLNGVLLHRHEHAPVCFLPGNRLL